MLTFFSFIDTLVAFFGVFFYLAIYMATFNTDVLFEVRIHGFSGCIAAQLLLCSTRATLSRHLGQGMPKFRSHLVPSFPLVGYSTLPPVKECKYLGLTIDSQLTLSSHICSICRNAYLHQIGKIRRFVDAPTTLRLVHDFVLPTHRLLQCCICQPSFHPARKHAEGYQRSC